MHTHFFSLLSASLGLLSLVSAGDTSACTYAAGKLSGCPTGTVYVKGGDVAALQGALSSKSPAVLVGAGTYDGRLTIDQPKMVFGDGAVTFQSSGVHTGGRSNADFATLNIKAMGNVALYNIIVQNNGDPGTGKGPLGPSLAVNIASGAYVAMYGCTLKSWQDTINISGELYMRGGAVYGWVDQIYGDGSAFFQSVAFKILGCGAAIMAPRGASGGVFVANECTINKAENARSDATGCFLARPWDSQAHAIYIKCKMDAVVAPAGWTVWYANDPRITAQTFFREYKTLGDTSGRNKLGGTLTDAEAAQYGNYRNVVPDVVVAA